MKVEGGRLPNKATPAIVLLGRRGCLMSETHKVRKCGVRKVPEAPSPKVGKFQISRCGADNGRSVPAASPKLWKMRRGKLWKMRGQKV